MATNAAECVTNLFLTLLEIQFPVTKQYHEPLLKNAQECTDRLAVHVNSLNRVVKEVTGKLTTMHIAERLTSEAKLLLQHRDWSVSEIADSLGFETRPISTASSRSTLVPRRLRFATRCTKCYSLLKRL